MVVIVGAIPALILCLKTLEIILQGGVGKNKSTVAVSILFLYQVPLFYHIRLIRFDENTYKQKIGNEMSFLTDEQEKKKNLDFLLNMAYQHFK